MSEVSERYRVIADGFTARLDGLEGAAPDRWSAPTPCPDWTVRDLVAHVIGTQRWVTAALEGTEAAGVEPDGDLAGQWRAASGAILDALTDEDRAAQVVSTFFGEQPFESLVGRVVCADTLIHTWDLARATGQDEQLDDHAVSTAMDFLGPNDEAIRRPGAFAAKITPPPEADEQTKLLNFCGRAV